MDSTNPTAPTSASRCSTCAGRVLIARRFKDDGPEIIMPGLEWQMPQGGIDPDENPRPAAVRELYEETGVTSGRYLGETPNWMTYEFPPYDGPPHRLAVFRGQRQKWFAFRFTGDEREIVVADVRNGQPPEFDAWRWEPLTNLANAGRAVPARDLSGGGEGIREVRGVSVSPHEAQRNAGSVSTDASSARDTPLRLHPGYEHTLSATPSPAGACPPAR